MYRSNLWYERNRMLPADFITGTRYHLNLPQLMRPNDTMGHEKAIDHPELSQQAVCDNDHGLPVTLDPTGAHATYCVTGAKARYGLHTALNSAVNAFAKEAGAITSVEPPTTGLLMNRYGAAQCRLMHPKKLTAASKERRQTMRTLTEQLGTMQPGDAKTKLGQEIQAFAAKTPEAWGGLRIDLQVTFQSEEVWVDVGSVHPTPNSKITAVTNWTGRLSAAEAAIRGDRGRNSMMKEPSPTVKTACATKHKRYDELVRMAGKQKVDGQRPHAPRFYAAIVSHSGELAPEFIVMIEKFTRQFAKHVGTLNLEDGVRPAKRTSDYRSRFKDAIMCTVLKGFGRTLNAVGLPWDRSGDDTLSDENNFFLPSREEEL